MLKELLWQALSEAAGHLGSFSPGIDPAKHDIFIYLFLFLNVNFGPSKK